MVIMILDSLLHTRYYRPDDYEFGCLVIYTILGDQDDCKIRVKVLLLWKQSYKNNPSIASSMEMILIDSEGNKICGSIKRYLIPDFEDIMREGNFFVITNFGVGEYAGDYKLLDHEWKINFYRTTKLRRCPAFKIATDGYQPVSYDDILEWKISKSAAFDVVGMLISLQELRVNRENGRDTRSIEFVLQDVSGKRISCALWSDHATQLFDFVSNHKDQTDPVIMLIHNAKLKEWRRMPQVSNQLFGCRVYINEDINPITAFKSDLGSDLANVDASNTPLPNMNVETVVKTTLDYYTNAPAKTLEEVRMTSEVSGCVVKAKVSRISIDDGWFTYGCKTCGKKAGHRFGGETGEIIYECATCGIVKDVYSKIRTVIRVQDRTGSTSLVLFDNQLSKMVNRSVSWLNAKKENSADPHMLPAEFDVILHKEYVFTIRISEFNLKFNYSAYTVDSVTEDIEVIDAIHAKLVSKEPQFDFEVSTSLEVTPTSKVQLSDAVNEATSSNDNWTPDNHSLKRKSESPPDVESCEASTTSKTVERIAGLKIPRMEDI